ncbi:uncharacterized protein LOC134243574 [Saccostrea cucullata]|uniref:uncharacterized protein LOC134243574 n=1 Tax=Saccostrea cuccullata TaxID=36930 RepID=UPI002ED5E754
MDIEFCEVSKLTRTVVRNCAKDLAGVKEAARKKNCSAIKSTCLGRLEYHCVINPWGNLTVEVCAPATNISKGYCTEYNEGGGKIQEHYNRRCSACNKKYVSTDAYKYPECYPRQKADVPELLLSGIPRPQILEKSKERFPHVNGDNGLKAYACVERKSFLILLYAVFLLASFCSA